MDGIKKVLKDREKLIIDVSDIINEVITQKDKALIRYTDKYDGIKLNSQEIEVSEEEWKKIADSIEPELCDILKKAAENIRSYAEKQNINKDYEIDNNGIQIKDKFIPVESVGVYVPGGNYPYPSTVLMCAIPAKVAGVKEVIMVTPPGNLTPTVLAAARIAGVDRIFRVGGAHAVAALALGNTVIPKVDKIVGPGNDYVQYAKLLLSDIVGIDMFSGPSEVVIVADKHQNSEWVAADLMAQAEHASDASAVLLTDSKELIEDVTKQIGKFSAKFTGKIHIESVKDLDMAVERANELAPEHLQLMCSDENIKKVEGKIKNAGAVFLGSNTPVAVGDYLAGPSHTLPTGGSARYQEGLNVRSFLKKVSFIRCTDESIKESAPLIEKFAKEEGMKYHAESIKKRIDKK